MRPAAVLVDIGGHLCSFLHAFLHQMHNIEWTVCRSGDGGMNTGEHVGVCMCMHLCVHVYMHAHTEKPL